MTYVDNDIIDDVRTHSHTTHRTTEQKRTRQRQRQRIYPQIELPVDVHNARAMASQ